MNTTSNVTSPSLDPVLWESVFWGLVPIAFNSMSQPSGRICDAPSVIGPWMRVSPIICFIDMILIIVRLFTYSFQRSFRYACLTVMAQRYGYDNQESSAFDEFRKNTICRLIIFAFSVSQIVKLYAFGGLIWPKVWASMYLASFLVNEILVFVSMPHIHADEAEKKVIEYQQLLDIESRKSTNSQQSLEDPVMPHVNSNAKWPPRGPQPKDMPIDHGFFSWPYLSATAGVILNIYCAIKAVSAVFQIYGRHFGQIPSTGLVIFVAGSTLFTIPSSLYAFRICTKRTNKSFVIGLLISTTVLPVAYLSTSANPGASALKPLITNVIVAIMVGVWALIALAWASHIFSPIVDQQRDESERIGNGLARYFFVFSVVATVLYYRFSYDPKDTFKPAWTDHLG